MTTESIVSKVSNSCHSLDEQLEIVGRNEHEIDAMLKCSEATAKPIKKPITKKARP